MSLPPTFCTAEEYFEACMSFLMRYRDLYWRSNTDILADNLDFHVQLSDHDVSDSKNYGNSFADKFFEDLARLTPCYESFTSNESVDSRVQTPMSKKKAHEVVHLTEEITNVCRTAGCQTVVDLGSGLGYIDNQIFAKTGYNILALEGQEALYVNAKEHQRKYHSESLGKVKYIRHVVSESSDAKITSFLKDKFPNDDKGFCFMGLHACGDLTVSAIKLFLKMQDSRALVVTPCCYHKMAPGEEKKFRNFPLSETLKNIYEKFDADTFLDRPFLRMAAQPAYVRDEDIQNRVFCLIARALLKVYARKHNCVVQKKRRKPVRMPSLNNDFATYAKEATTKGFKLIPVISNDNELMEETSFNLQELQSMWEDIPENTFKNAALYISYQNHLPPIFENFILYDRLIYLKEQGVQSCYYKKVVNEKISPKCLSLFANKAIHNAVYLLLILYLNKLSIIESVLSV